MEDTELVDGLVFTQKSANVNGPRRVEKAKIGLIQFCISPPKTDVSLHLIQCLLSRLKPQQITYFILFSCLFMKIDIGILICVCFIHFKCHFISGRNKTITHIFGFF